jgi:hypothetical protein
MVLVSLYGVSDLFNIMLDYSDGVWIQEMMQLMLPDDTNNDDDAIGRMVCLCLRPFLSITP